MNKVLVEIADLGVYWMAYCPNQIIKYHTDFKKKDLLKKVARYCGVVYENLQAVEVNKLDLISGLRNK